MRFENYLLQLSDNEKILRNKEEICLFGCSIIIKQIYLDIKKIKRKETIKFIFDSLNIPYQTFYCWTVGSNPIPISKMILLLKLWQDTLKMTDREFYKKINEIYDNVDFYSQNGQRKVKLPKEFDEDLAYIIGFFQGDGHLKKENKKGFQEFSIYFYEANKEMLNKINKIIYDKFGIKGNIYYQKNITGEWFSLRVSSKPIYLFFKNVLMLRTGRKVRSIEVPLIISKSNNRMQLAFIRGFFDAEGAVGETIKSPWLAIGQASNDILPEILVWIRKRLKNEGIILSDVRKSPNQDFYRIRTSKREYIKSFFDVVSSYHIKKINKFKEIIEKC